MDKPTMNLPTDDTQTVILLPNSLTPNEQQLHHSHQKVPLLNERYEFNVEALKILQGLQTSLTSSLTLLQEL
jgi:hypothetical protein